MNNEYYVITKSDNTVSILERNLDLSTMPGLKELKTLEQLLIELNESYQTNYGVTIVKHRSLSSVDLLPIRYFRDCWTDEIPGEQVDVDMPKARIQRMDELRLTRDDKLKELDVAYMKALEAKDTAQMDIITAKKKALRDMPVDSKPELDSIESPNQLKDYKPSVLIN